MGMLQMSKQCMELKTGFAVTVGPHTSMVYGGPYRRYIDGQRRLIGVKMAAEIDAPCDISIPTQDFSVPDVESMQRGLMDAISAIAAGNDLYVGCMGGVGRTGLFMGCLLKSMQDAGNDCIGEADDPVVVVRELYASHAIETEEQKAYVRGFPSAPVVERIRAYDPKVEIVEVQVVRHVPVAMSPWASLKALFGFKA